MSFAFFPRLRAILSNRDGLRRTDSGQYARNCFGETAAPWRPSKEENMSFFRNLLAAAILGLALDCSAQPAAAQSVATFAGGCFWCMEAAYDGVPGVVSTTSGYMGGTKKNPKYEDVSSGTTGHAEVVQIVYDPNKISYEKLLEIFWKNIDPTVRDRQFCDVGNQYRASVFYHNEEQKRLAEASKGSLTKTKPFRENIVTPIVPAGEFWPAEDYHQDFYVKNPVRYKFYRTGCGRDARLKQLWGSAPH
jgi:peptide-methionine (S)-S-oxide reductase